MSIHTFPVVETIAWTEQSVCVSDTVKSSGERVGLKTNTFSEKDPNYAGWKLHVRASCRDLEGAVVAVERPALFIAKAGGNLPQSTAFISVGDRRRFEICSEQLSRCSAGRVTSKFHQHESFSAFEGQRKELPALGRVQVRGSQAGGRSAQ